MKVTIGNYTSMALMTWSGDNQQERAELGIIGEFGEMCEVQKKFLRGDFDEAERNKRMIKEIGDCLFYIAIDSYLGDNDFLFYITEYIDAIELKGEDGTTITDCLTDYFESPLFKCISVISVLNLDVENVMQENIDKLQSRLKRDKISGDGDER